MHEAFRKFSHRISELMGSAWAFIIAMCAVIIWAIFGPIFNFSNTWQLFINTMTTVLTFLMVFLIQNTQNRDARATHLKLDELIHSVTKAHNNMIHIEDLSDEELDRLGQKFEKYKVHADARRANKAKPTHIA